MAFVYVKGQLHLLYHAEILHVSLRALSLCMVPELPIFVSSANLEVKLEENINATDTRHKNSRGPIEEYANFRRLLPQYSRFVTRCSACA